jgi:heme/copper-type cytochrome/quinol oxidase subunit 4
MVVVPGLLWMKRGAQDGTRYGTSMGLAIIGVICAIVTFAPFGMFVTAQPDKFNTPIFYILGCVCTLIAVIYVWILAKIPPKQKVAGEKAPIW